MRRPPGPGAGPHRPSRRPAGAAATILSMADGPKRAKLPLPHPPDIDQGVQSFLWAIVLGFLIWLFLMGLGSSMAFSTLIGGLSAVAIFFIVRIFGEEAPSKPRKRRR